MFIFIVQKRKNSDPTSKFNHTSETIPKLNMILAPCAHDSLAHAERSGASQPPALTSGAAQPAPLSGTLRKLVEDVKQFGRVPKRNNGTSTQDRVEDRLYRRFTAQRDSIPDEVLQELQALGGAPQPAVDPEQAVRKLVEDVKQFGGIPKRNKGTSEAQKAEDRLYRRFLANRDTIPHEVLQELQALVHPRDRAM